MKIQEMDILKHLLRHPFVNQRELSEQIGFSLGIVNQSLRELESQGYLDKEKHLTEAAEKLIEKNKPRRAIILSAGVGMRMVPINMETPKGLIHVRGEVLIERLIRQLHEAGIGEIYVVVGFMKERFEYLMDDFGVQLVVNRDYATTNSLRSLCLVQDKLAGAYILPCDLWCRENLFRQEELYSWYMVKNCESNRSRVRVNRKMELCRIEKGNPGNPMVGISYITPGDAPALRKRIAELSRDPEYDQGFWEEAVYENGRMTVLARLIPEDQAVEINTYEQLRELDNRSEQLKSKAITTACQALRVEPEQICSIKVLKKGMTNRSFLFTCQGSQYIMRIPGEGTDQLINRRNEASVYEVIRNRGICDDIIEIDPENGYKITRFIPDARSCDPTDDEDLEKCMDLLRSFHSQKLQVAHSFDVFKKIEFYQSLWQGKPSVYRDYEKTKADVFSLRSYIDHHVQERILCHVDSVPDNFLFYRNAEGKEEIRLIDWEYAAMQDPHLDVAMFCIYALYNKEQIDHLIDIYFRNQCPREIRIKIYCYVAACGLVWSNWCEYKRNLGVEFGEYSMRQYRYAKDFYRYATGEMKKLQERGNCDGESR